MSDGSPDLADRRGEEQVYQPAEDSRLLATVAVGRIDADDRVCEVGVGSGWVAARVAAETDATVVGTDVNPHACRAARERGVETVRADLVSPFRDAAFDVVCCNPPYLPTDPETSWGDWMEAALAGGPEGRAVVDPFLDAVGRVLAPGGEALLLVSTLTGLDAVRERADTNGLAVERLREEAHPFETLVVLRLTPNRNHQPDEH